MARVTINTMQEQGKKLLLKFKSLNKKNRELTKIQDDQNLLIKQLSVDMAKLIGEKRELQDRLDSTKQ